MEEGQGMMNSAIKLLSSRGCWKIKDQVSGGQFEWSKWSLGKWSRCEIKMWRSCV